MASNVNAEGQNGKTAAERDVSQQTDIMKVVPRADGTFQRKASTFRNLIEKGGQFEPELGEFHRTSVDRYTCLHLVDRYHLYVSYACRRFI